MVIEVLGLFPTQHLFLGWHNANLNTAADLLQVTQIPGTSLRLGRLEALSWHNGHHGVDASALHIDIGLNAHIVEQPGGLDVVIPVVVLLADFVVLLHGLNYVLYFVVQRVQLAYLARKQLFLEQASGLGRVLLYFLGQVLQQ